MLTAYLKPRYLLTSQIFAGGRRHECALLNGAKSTLAVFRQTNLVWTVLRAIWGIRNALLQVRC